VLTLTQWPSPAPTFDPRPMLEVVQTRGHVRCGLLAEEVGFKEGHYYDLCRAVAAVLLGNPDKIKPVPLTWANRFHQLLDRSVDLLLLGDTHTIEREVREKTTGSGFTFSSPYDYSTISYFGNETFVGCAEERKRYGECSSLVICGVEGTTHFDYVQSAFPSDFLFVVSSYEDSIEMLLSEKCNVITVSRSELAAIVASNDEIADRNFTVGKKRLINDPLAAVTRNDE